MSLCLIGASGFVGSRALALAKGPVRTLGRRRPLPNAAVQGDATDPVALERLLEPEAVVLNFAYQAGAAEKLAEALGAACAARKVRRLVHVSTVSVYGAARGEVVDEDTPCAPRTSYEREKYAAEQILERHARGRFELVLLRPTAVFGPGGRNLESMARRVLRQPWPLRYLRATVMGRRRMHAVDVDCVAAAAHFAAGHGMSAGIERFIVSQDDELANDYAALEAFFAWRFGKPHPLPPIALPAGVLATALRLAGRSNAEPSRRYDNSRLLGRGFRPPRTFVSALEEYATWIQNHARA